MKCSRKTLFTKRDISRKIEDLNYENKILVLNVKNFKKEFKEAKYQLFYANSGNGTTAYKFGKGIFGMFLEDSEVVKIKREDVIGVLKESLVKKYEIDIESLAKTFKYYVEEV